MKRIVLLVGLCSIVMLPGSLDAKPSPGPVQPVAMMTPAEEVRALANGEITFEQVSEEMRDVIESVGKARAADRAGKLIAIMMMLAAAFKLLISGFKVAARFDFWTKSQKNVLRLGTVVLGVLVYLTSSIGAGVPWWEALVLALSGPGSVVVHEYSALFGVKAKH